MTTGPEAGWYDDGSGKQRWWDGSRWTEQYIDLRDYRTELHTGTAPARGAAAAGWYDDGRGRQRWWDGTRWSDAARFSGSEESFAGIVVDGRWIHFGALSEPIAGASAPVSSCCGVDASAERPPLVRCTGPPDPSLRDCFPARSSPSGPTSWSR